MGTYGGIVAFDANGSRGCSGSPKVCTPLWEYATNYPVVDGYAADSGTTLYLDTFYSPAPRQFEGDTEAFDANGSSGCSGMPTLCTPLWSSGYYSLNAAPLVGVRGSAFVSPPWRLWYRRTRYGWITEMEYHASQQSEGACYRGFGPICQRRHRRLRI